MDKTKEQVLNMIGFLKEYQKFCENYYLFVEGLKENK